VLLVVHVYREDNHAKEIIRIISASESERRAVRELARRQASGADSRSNETDIPRLSAEQLAAMVRLRDARPPKVVVSVRLDVRVLDWLKSKGEGHLTRINDILTKLMEAEGGKTPSGSSRAGRKP
jgi:uncharacterized protein (DUF4415 family)